MSARHTRSGHLANDLHNGTCYVPSMGWVGSVMPAGRHRVGLSVKAITALATGAHPRRDPR